MDVHSVGKTETLEDIPLKYFVVVPYCGDYHVITCDTKEEAIIYYNNPSEGRGVAIIRGVVIEGALE